MSKHRQLFVRHTSMAKQGQHHKTAGRGLVLALLAMLVATWWWVWGDCANPFVTSCWLGDSGDRVQHFAGWMSILHNSAPSAVTKRLSWPITSSLVYTDSIPLLGLLLQPLGQLVPAGFQYFSLAHLGSILITSWAAITIATAQGISRVGTVVLVIALALAPTAIVRTVAHTSLSFQGLIVWALVWLMQRQYSPWRWGSLVAVSMGVHAYLTGMVLVLWGLGQVNAWCQKKRWQALLGLLSMPIILTACYHLFGYGVGADPADTETIWSANLLALIDPQGRSGWFGRFGAFPIQMPWQWEGFAYLGLPVLLALLLLAPNRFRKPDEASLFPYPRLLWAVMVAMALFAIGPEIWLGPWKLISLRSTPLISLLTPAYGFFRSTGRFIWPLYNTLLIWVICRLDQRLNLPWLMALMGAAIVLETQVPSLLRAKGKAHSDLISGRNYNNKHSETIRLIQALQCQGVTHLINATGQPYEPVPGLPTFTLTLLAPEINTNIATYLARRPAGFDHIYLNQSGESIVARVEQDLQKTRKVVYILKSSQVMAWAIHAPLVSVAHLSTNYGLYAVSGRWGLRNDTPNGCGTNRRG